MITPSSNESNQKSLTLPTITKTLSLQDMCQVEKLLRNAYGKSWNEIIGRLSFDVRVCTAADVPCSSWCIFRTSEAFAWLVYKDDEGTMWSPSVSGTSNIMFVVREKSDDTTGDDAVIIQSPYLPTPTYEYLKSLHRQRFSGEP